MAATNTETLGDHQEIHVGEWRADRRGLLSGSIQRHVVEDFDKVDLKMLAVKAAPPTGITCIGVVRSYKTPHAIYTYSYEGVGPDHDGEDEANITFELDITSEEVSLEAHPNLAKIEKAYGGFDTTLKRFKQKFLSKGSGVPLQNGADAAANLGQRLNPAFGTDSYMAFGATFKRCYTSRFIPAHVLRNIGAIVAKPRGLSKFPLPAASKRRKWLKVAPHIVLRGNCVTIEENYIMAGRHGILPEIYSTLALQEEPDGGASGGGSGLTTGTLTTGKL